MNKSGNQNRSVRNTKKRLKEALLILLQKKPVNEISVTELSELADVNRGTFIFTIQMYMIYFTGRRTSFSGNLKKYLILTKTAKPIYIGTC